MSKTYPLGVSIALLSLIVACSDSVQSVDRRGEVAATLTPIGNGEKPSGDGDIQGGSKPEQNYLSPTLVEAKNSSSLSSEFKANIALINKVSANEIMLFGKDGRAWQYAPATDAVPKLIEAAIVKLDGYSLFTLPEGKFWLVGPQTLGRRKAGEAVEGSVPVENFNTESIKGDWNKVRVLFAAADTIILHLDSSIAILSIRNGTPSLSQFSSQIPVAIEGGIVAAGQTEAGGFWFAGKESFALLEYSGLELKWTKAKVPWTGHEDYSQLAVRIDSALKQVVGEALMLQGDRYWSVSGAPVQ